MSDAADTDGGALAGGPNTVICPGCSAVYDQRYLTECCRYEAGQGYRCPACNHFLEQEQTP